MLRIGSETQMNAGWNQVMEKLPREFQDWWPQACFAGFFSCCALNSADAVLVPRAIRWIIRTVLGAGNET